ncbi:MAG TPA: tyrosine-type recombinase/integrase [Edaphocola sp.]|nr:tyrosine-type recombinase/integrase [Edaphocola sp.]
MTFNEHLHLKGYSSKSIMTIEKIVSYFKQWCNQENIADETEVNHNDIIAYIKSCTAKGVTQKTTANYVSHIKKYYDYLIKEKGIPDNPCSYINIKGIKRKVVYDIIPFEALESLYHLYRTDTGNKKQQLIRKRNKAMLGLLIYQGLQSEELIKLEIQDLQLRDGKIRIHAGRRSAGRNMKLEASQAFELIDYLNDTRKSLLQQAERTAQEETALFITSEKGVRVGSNTISTLLKQIRKINSKTGGEHSRTITSINQIRASVIVHWLKLYHLRKVQHLAGHKYISSTERYQSSNLEDLKEDISKYHPF